MTAMHLLSAVIVSLVGYGLVSMQGCSGPSEPWEPSDYGAQCYCSFRTRQNASTEEECESRPERANLSGAVSASEWESGVGAACRNLSTDIEDGVGCFCDYAPRDRVTEGRLYSSSKGACKAGVIYGQTSQENDWIKPKDSQGPRNPANPDAALASHFLSVGLSEHASVASFSRVVLELMQFGAPAELLDRTLVAAQEEIRHAQMAFTLSNEWSPEPFVLRPLKGLEFNTITLAEFANQTVTEAVEGETPAALRAALALHFVEHQGVRDYLKQVAEEERRHAELAWATLAWTCLKGNQEGPAVQASAMSALDHAALQLKACPVLKKSNLQHGILSPDLEALVCREAASLVQLLKTEMQGIDGIDGLKLFELRVQEHFEKAVTSVSRQQM